MLREGDIVEMLYQMALAELRLFDEHTGAWPELIHRMRARVLFDAASAIGDRHDILKAWTCPSCGSNSRGRICGVCLFTIPYTLFP